MFREHRNLIESIRDLPHGLARISALNVGNLTERVTRLAALGYAEDLKADDYGIADSVGPCVLGYRHASTRQPGGRGWLVTMVGPTGDHTMSVTEADLAEEGQIITARVRVHWLGFLENNCIKVPQDVKDRADAAAGNGNLEARAAAAG